MILFNEPSCAQFAMALVRKIDAGKMFGAERHCMDRRIGFTIRNGLMTQKTIYAEFLMTAPFITDKLGVVFFGVGCRTVPMAMALGWGEWQ